MIAFAGGFLPLEEYGIIGNQETCALIGRNGSIDWLCLPYLDSPSVFAALLDPRRGGAFSVTPLLKYGAVQEYFPQTNILVTTFTTSTGKAAVTDFMPPAESGEGYRRLLRKIEGMRKGVTLRLSFRPRFDYGRGAARISPMAGGVQAEWEKFSLALHGAKFAIDGDGAAATLELREGNTAWLVLCWGGEKAAPEAAECQRLLERTRDFWTAWSSAHSRSESVHVELCHDLAYRSGLVLKLLLNPGQGGIAAAATTSLPESIGGLRNWDYRFAWLRDAGFTAQALYHLGYQPEARQYRLWVTKILAENQDLVELRPLYPLHANASIHEGAAESLCGYRFSAPVRVGNLAERQTQLDIFGEVVNTVFETVRYGEKIEAQVWETVRRICDFVAAHWSMKDRGIWEVRTAPRHFVHSKVMCWVALDRGIEMAERFDLDAPVEQWRQAAAELHQAIVQKGFSLRLNSFVQSFDGEEIDAATLLIPIHRFLPADDPRVRGTIDAVRERLAAGNGLLYRYSTDDGLAGTEGAFLLCSFWLVSALAVCRRVEEAETLFRQLLAQVSPLGLLSEEVDPRDGRLIGNFPQAISHIGLVNAALHLGIAKGRGHRGPPPQAEAPGNKAAIPAAFDPERDDGSTP